MTSSYVLAIDPGNIESAYVRVDSKSLAILDHGKILNSDMLDMVRGWMSLFGGDIVCEMIGHYGSGMPAGKTVFDTCLMIGRIIEASGGKVDLMLRPTVKAHICGSAKAKDSNVIQALKDRFGDRGTKANPGHFYGVKADVWQAYSLAVAYIEGAKILERVE